LEPNYLKLIVENFEKTKKIESAIELQEKQIQEAIISEQLRFEKTKQISENTFLNGCNRAVDILTKFVDKEIKSEKYKNSQNSIFRILGETIENTPAVNQTVNYETFAVSILSLVPSAKETLCFNDIKFLQSTIKKIGIDTSKEPEPLDLSDNSVVQKIIYLNELGIIDLLRKEPSFATSVNNLATVISAITGAKAQTVQPVLNALINKTNGKNDPYNTISTVDKVKNHLINLGITPK
jgi:hypothetical protein